MTGALSKNELRFVGSGLLVAILAAGGLAVAVWAPWAARSIEGADLALATGDEAAAMASYVELAETAWTEEDRAEALWRAAQLARAEGDVSEAVGLLSRFADTYPTDPRSAEAMADQAELYRAVMGRPAEAARAWGSAARHGTDAERSGHWWMRAGRAWLDAGDPSQAKVAFRAATGTAETSTAAWLALGNLALAADPAEAYDAYDRALSASEAAEMAKLARLGMATAMERLDGAEAALAEVDAEGELDTALERRRTRLEGQLDN